VPPTRPEDEAPEPDEVVPLPPDDSGADDRSDAEREASEFGGE